MLKGVGLNRRSEKNSTVLLTLATGAYEELLEYSGPVMKMYAEKWCWDYYPVIESLDKTRPDAWSKLLAISECLSRYETVVYIDSDALILNLDTNILQEIPNEFEFAWALGEINGIQTPNAGVMVIRRTTNTINLFEMAYGITHLIYDAWWDQIALMTALNYVDPRSEIKRKVINIDAEKQVSVYHLPNKWNVTSQEVGIGETNIRHFAGDPFILKKIFMIEYLSRTYKGVALIDFGFDSSWLKRDYNRIRKEIFEKLTPKRKKLYFVLQNFFAKLRIRKIKYR